MDEAVKNDEIYIKRSPFAQGSGQKPDEIVKNWEKGSEKSCPKSFLQSENISSIFSDRAHFPSRTLAANKLVHLTEKPQRVDYLDNLGKPDKKAFLEVFLQLLLLDLEETDLPTEGVLREATLDHRLDRR